MNRQMLADRLVNELAAWLVALEDAAMYEPVPDSLVQHGRMYIHGALTEKHSGDCTNECHTCVVCSGSDHIAKAKQILAALTGAEPQTALCWIAHGRAIVTERCLRFSAPHCQAEIVPVPKAALDWLFGEGAGPDGKWFGDDQDTEQRTPRKYSHAYWWRSKFRSMIPALTRPERKP